MPAASVSLGVLLLTVLFWPIGWFARRRYRAAMPIAGTALRAYKWTRWASLAVLIVLVGWMAMIGALFANLENLAGAFDMLLWVLQIAGLIAFVAAGRDRGMERLVDLARWSQMDGEDLEHADRGFFGRAAVRRLHLQSPLDDGELLMRLKLDVAVETLRLAQPFKISGYCFETADVVYVTLDDGTHRGRGEAAGVYYMQDDLAHMTKALEDARAQIEAGPTRQTLREILPPGGARAAVDAALWELEARRAGTTAWRIAGLASVHPVRTTLTVSADTAEAMAARAIKDASTKAIKVKLTGELDLDLAARAVDPCRAPRRLVGSRCQSRLFDRRTAGAGARAVRATRAAARAAAAARP